MSNNEVIIPKIYNGLDQLYILENIITTEIETNLINFFNSKQSDDKCKWTPITASKNARKVIQYGRNYSYSQRKRYRFI